ncbi:MULTISPECIES: DUF3606 domain-containing protein [Microvirga]|uniref:DUF3606 domain-containing protein n=1 Tax=Microvirga TaxID=186650 RepID=UPI001D0016AD|nr:DUF3606 domain-containing protein [Microvirga lenta]MCB5177243.1 DUF3606 domain-containing protein [Microvirga lenta]
MIGNLSKRHPQDSARIDIHEDWEVRYWSDRWQVSRRQLIDTAKRVGFQVSEVAKALGKSA